MVLVSWPSTQPACSAVSQTTLSPPQRSPYSEKFFENELATTQVTPASARARTA
ncbi:Uncharacterised protein [Bordetella pertussis]|nr:Uncharacterised protein [Bordetella pertussis]